MAWRSHGSSNATLVDALKGSGLIKSASVEQALRALDRGNYCPTNPYQDSPQRIGHWATISAPHMHAHCLSELVGHLREGGSVLDCGSGSGYLAAAFAHMVGVTGKVVGVDHIKELVDLSIENTKKADATLLDSGRLQLICADGRQGWSDGAPYDVIHVGAAAKTVPPALLEQLAPGGRLIIPVGSV